MTKVQKSVMDKGPIVVYGPPGCGVSSLITCLAGATKQPTGMVAFHPERLHQIELALQDAPLVFVDVPQGDLVPEDIQNLVDAGLLHAGAGAVIRVWVDSEELLSRYASAETPNTHTLADIQSFSQRAADLEGMLRLHNIHSFMVINHDLVEGVKQLALRCGIKD